MTLGNYLCRSAVAVLVQHLKSIGDEICFGCMFYRKITYVHYKALILCYVIILERPSEAMLLWRNIDHLLMIYAIGWIRWCLGFVILGCKHMTSWRLWKIAIDNFFMGENWIMEMILIKNIRYVWNCISD